MTLPPSPHPSAALPEARIAFMLGGGQGGALMRGVDWSATPLGVPEGWPQALRTLVAVMLGSAQPMFVAWGPSRTMLYNDAYAQICGDRHPAAMGAPFAAVWFDIMDEVGPILERAFAGEATHMDDIAFTLHRSGYPEEAHFAFSYTPVRGQGGEVEGMFCACMETTAQVLSERARRAAEGRTTGLLESIHDAFLALDRDWRFTHVNGEAERLLGYRAAELIGRVVWEAYPALGGTAFEGIYRRAAATGEPGSVTAFYPEHGRWYEVRAYPWADGISVFFRDVTAERQVGEALRESEARLRFLGEMDEATRTLRDPLEVMAAATRLLRERLGVSRCAYADVDADADGFTIRNDANAPGQASSAGTYRLDLFGPRAAADMRGGRTLVVHDVAAELAPGEGRETFLGIGIEAIICCPLVKDGLLVAMMAVHHAGARAWTPEEVRLVEAAVERCWAHVERVGAEARLREGEAQQGFLLRLSDAIRPLHDAGKVQAEACRRLGEHLGVAQVGFGEIGPSQDFVTIHCDWSSGRLPSILGTWRMDDFGPDFIADIRRGETAVIPDVARDPRTDAPEVLAAYARIGIRAVLDVPLIKGGRMVAVLFIHHPEPRSWSRADVSLVEEASVRLWEAVERSRAEAALRESERRLGAALAAARLGSFEWNRATDAMALDGRSREIFGFAESEGLCGEELFARIHPDDLPRVRGEVQASADTLTRLVTEYRILPPGGGVRFLASLADAHADASGRAVRLVGLFADVTERRAAEERQILLSREVDHRAKNALAVVQSVVQLTESRDPVAFKRAVLGRISALSRAQTLLADESWSGADLRTLLMGELEPFLGDREIEVEGPPAVLPPGAAQPMAMAFHELATNAVKYGALSVREGRLSVLWRLVPGPDGFPLLRFRWAEAGGPPIAAAPERRGFGSRVLDGTLRRQLGGSMVQRWEPSGLVCTIEVPLTPVVQDAAAGGEGAAR